MVFWCLEYTVSSFRYRYPFWTFSNYLDVLEFEKRRFHFWFKTFSISISVTGVSRNRRFRIWIFLFWTFCVLDVFSLDVCRTPVSDVFSFWTFSVLDGFQDKVFSRPVMDDGRFQDHTFSHRL